MGINFEYSEKRIMKRHFILSIIIGAVFLVGVLNSNFARADDSADISELKKQVAQLQQKIESIEESQFNAQDSLDARVNIHGTLSQGYLKSDGAFMQAQDASGPRDTSTFHYNEFAFNITADLTDKMWAGFQLMSRDFLVLMDNKIYLDWALLDYAWKDELGLRAGRLKVPMGLHNSSRDIDAARTSIFLPGSLYSEIRRNHFNFADGVGLYGSIDLWDVSTLNYSVVYGDADIERKGYVAEQGLTDYEITAEDIFAIQLLWDTPIEGLRVGGSYFETDIHVLGNFDATPYGGAASNYWYFLYDKYNVYVTSIEYTWDDLIITGEYQETRLTVRDNIFGETPVHFMGWYISSSYRFTGWLAGEISYSEFYRSSDDKAGDNMVALGFPDYYAWQKDWSLNARFDITKNLLAKAGVVIKDGLGVTDQAVPASLSERNWMLYQLKVTVSF